MVRVLGDDFVRKNVPPYLQASRLSRPKELAEAVRDRIARSTPSGPPWDEARWPWSDTAWSLPI